MQTNQDNPDQARVDEAIRKAMKTDIAIGVMSLAPLAYSFNRMVQDDSFNIGSLGPIALLYCWAMGACFVLCIRKIRDAGLRKSIWLFSSGTFASCFILLFAVMPPLFALGAVPIATYLLTKMRAQRYLELDLRKEIAGRHSGQGQLEV